jgi:hypothetical protein
MTIVRQPPSPDTIARATAWKAPQIPAATIPDEPENISSSSATLASLVSPSTSLKPLLQTFELNREGFTNIQQMLAVRICREDFINSDRPIQYRPISEAALLLMNIRFAYQPSGASLLPYDKDRGVKAIRSFVALPADSKGVAVLEEHEKRLSTLLELEKVNAGRTPTTYLEERKYRETIEDFLPLQRHDIKGENVRENLERIFETYFFMRKFNSRLDEKRLERSILVLTHPDKMKRKNFASYQTLFSRLVAFCAEQPDF